MYVYKNIYTHTYIFTYYIIFIHSSVDGYLCCFHSFAIVNDAVNIDWGAWIFSN